MCNFGPDDGQTLNRHVEHSYRRTSIHYLSIDINLIVNRLVNAGTEVVDPATHDILYNY